MRIEDCGGKKEFRCRWGPKTLSSTFEIQLIFISVSISFRIPHKKQQGYHM